MSPPARRLLDAGTALRAGRIVAAAEGLAAVAAMPQSAAAWQGRAVAPARPRADAMGRARALEARAAKSVAATLLFHGDIRRAHRLFVRALAADPGCLKAHWLMGDLRGRLGDGAVARYRRSAEIEPASCGPAYTLAALDAAPVPARAPNDYIVPLFDWYADTFDRVLVDYLDYRAPAAMAGALERATGGHGGLTALDLGCGTGLAGIAVRTQCARLVGVDLSAQMLAKARARPVRRAARCRCGGRAGAAAAGRL